VPDPIPVILDTAVADPEVKILDPPPVMLRVRVPVPPVPAVKYWTIMSRIAPDGTGIETVVIPVLPVVPVTRSILVAAVIDAVAVATLVTVRSAALRPLIWFSETLRTFYEPSAVRS
jgi:hypothetical protein